MLALIYGKCRIAGMVNRSAFFTYRKRCIRTMIRMLVCFGMLLCAGYFVAYHYHRDSIVERRMGQLEAALKEANSEWNGSIDIVDLYLPILLGDVTWNFYPAGLIISGDLSNLAPLDGMSLELLIILAPGVYDLASLEGMPLKLLDISGTKVSDLTPLKGIPLTELRLDNTPALKLPRPKWLKKGLGPKGWK